MTQRTAAGLILPHSTHTLEAVLPARDLVLNTHGVRVALDYLGQRTVNTNRGSLTQGMAWRSKTGLQAIALLEDSQNGSLIHCSVSRATRWPTWEEVHAVRDAVFPADMLVTMLILASRDMTRKHQVYAFDIWQLPGSSGIRS